MRRIAAIGIDGLPVLPLYKDLPVFASRGLVGHSLSSCIASSEETNRNTEQRPGRIESFAPGEHRLKDACVLVGHGDQCVAIAHACLQLDDPAR